MSIPDRKLWVKWRDAAKVPSGLGKHDMGPSFDKFTKLADPNSGANWKAKYDAVVQLRKLCLDYYEDLKKSKDKNAKAFASVFDNKVYKYVLEREKAYKLLAQPTLKVKAQLTALVQGIKGVTDATSWATFWSGPIRGVGTALPLVRDSLAPADQAKLKAAWPPHLSTDGYRAKGQQSDNDRNACVKEVGTQAVALNQLAHTLGWW